MSPKESPPPVAKKDQPDPVAPTTPEYKPTDLGKTKLQELVSKRDEYTEAVVKIDAMILQLRYGITQELGGKSPKEQCNGFGVGFDLSDYACRELCKRDLHTACRTIVEAGRKEKDKAREVLGAEHSQHFVV